LAEHCERPSDFLAIIKQLLKLTHSDKSDLTDEERQLLYSAYRLSLQQWRSSVKSARLSSIRAELSRKTKGQQPDQTQIGDAFIHAAQSESTLSDYKNSIEKEVVAESREAAQALEQSVISYVLRPESIILYLKLAADCYRLCAELSEKSTERVKFTTTANTLYAKAHGLSSSLPVTNPLRLGVSLNFSVLLYELANQKREACELARVTFDAAISRLDELDEAAYKDATLVMQLLRDNLTLWTQAEQQPR